MRARKRTHRIFSSDERAALLVTRALRSTVLARSAYGYTLKLAVAAACCIFAHSTIHAAREESEAKRHLILRYDDYAPVPLYRRSAGLELEERLFELIARNHAKLVVGVVPFPVADPSAPQRDPASIRPHDSWLARADDPWVRLLREHVARGTVEPALHGFEHRRPTPSGFRPGEFRAQLAEWQHHAVRAGRGALTAALTSPVQVFVPPWNAWDAATVRVLRESGFEWLSPDLHDQELPADTIRVVPQCAADPTAVLDLIRDRGAVPPGSIIVLVTHPFDFDGPTGEGYFRALERLLSAVSQSEEWDCVSFTDLTKGSIADWDERFRLAVAWEQAQSFLHDTWGPRWVLESVPTVYYAADWYPPRMGRAKFAVALTLIATAAAAWLVSWVAGRRVLRPRWAKRLAGWAMLAGLGWVCYGAAAVVNHGYHVRGMRWQAIAAGAGVSVGVWTCGIRRRRTEPTRLPSADPSALRDEPTFPVETS